ncbi:MAG: hypothetical protein AB2448_11955 [Moorella sp. (in: firmicutes)]
MANFVTGEEPDCRSTFPAGCEGLPASLSSLPGKSLPYREKILELLQRYGCGKHGRLALLAVKKRSTG